MYSVMIGCSGSVRLGAVNLVRRQQEPSERMLGAGAEVAKWGAGVWAEGAGGMFKVGKARDVMEAMVIQCRKLWGCSPQCQSQCGGVGVLVEGPRQLGVAQKNPTGCTGATILLLVQSVHPSPALP